MKENGSAKGPYFFTPNRIYFRRERDSMKYLFNSKEDLTTYLESCQSNESVLSSELFRCLLFLWLKIMLHVDYIKNKKAASEDTRSIVDVPANHDEAPLSPAPPVVGMVPLKLLQTLASGTSTVAD